MDANDTKQSRANAEHLMLKSQVSPDFLDSKLEWRRLFAETWGTFLLVLVAAGGGVVRDLSGGSVSLAMIVVAPGPKGLNQETKNPVSC
jgi:aquaporin Z